MPPMKDRVAGDAAGCTVMGIQWRIVWYQSTGKSARQRNSSWKNMPGAD